MQTVDFRNGLLRFKLPKRWTAEYLEDGGAMFREPEARGVLLLNVVDFDAPLPVNPDAAFDLLANYGGHEGREVLQLKNGSAFVAYAEEKEGLTAFIWEVARSIQPDGLRLAAFSFTTKTEAATDKVVVDIVSMLTKEIAATEF